MPRITVVMKVSSPESSDRVFSTTVVILFKRARRSMKKDIILGIALLTAAIFGLGVESVNSMNSVFANVKPSALEPIDSNLGECIKVWQAGNSTGALPHCEMADQELDPLLENTTG